MSRLTDVAAAVADALDAAAFSWTPLVIRRWRFDEERWGMPTPANPPLLIVTPDATEVERITRAGDTLETVTVVLEVVRAVNRGDAGCDPVELDTLAGYVSEVANYLLETRLAAIGTSAAEVEIEPLDRERLDESGLFYGRAAVTFRLFG